VTVLVTYAELHAAPGTIPFGEVVVGESRTLTLTLTNDGDRPIAIAGHQVVGSTAFTLLSALPAELGPGAAAVLSVRFEPTEVASVEATLRVSHDGGNDTVEVALHGEGAAPPPLEPDHQTWLLTTYATTSGWETHLVADVTGNGHPDLVSYHPSRGRRWVTESLGDGQFAAPRLLTTYATNVRVGHPPRRGRDRQRGSPTWCRTTRRVVGGG
jgi:urease beta subunit